MILSSPLSRLPLARVFHLTLTMVPFWPVARGRLSLRRSSSSLLVTVLGFSLKRMAVVGWSPGMRLPPLFLPLQSFLWCWGGRSQDGWAQWHGVAPELLVALFVGVLGQGWATETRVAQRRCVCGVKTAPLPAHDVGPWRRALRGSPFGSASVVDQWTCLGVRVSS